MVVFTFISVSLLTAFMNWKKIIIFGGDTAENANYY